MFTELVSLPHYTSVQVRKVLFQCYYYYYYYHHHHRRRRRQ
jgi:hypothetical protein